MRVTHVITRLIVGGAQENTIASVLGLRKKPGLEVNLLSGPTIGPEGSLESSLDDPSILGVIPELVRPIQPWKEVFALRRLRRIFEQQRPDVVHTHSGKAGILGRLAAAKAGVPIIVHTIHGPSFGPFQGGIANLTFKTAERRAGKVTTHFVVVADAMKEQYLAAGIGTPEMYSKIFSGFDLGPFLSAKNDLELREKFGFSPDDIVIGKIARLFKLKGHDDLLAIAPALVRDCPRVKFLLVGDGAWRARLEERVSALGLRDRFVFTGLVEPKAVAGLIGIVDVLVHLSLREGLPRSLSQALAVGRPVVAYDCDGAKEVCIEGETGFLVRPGDLATLKERLHRLANDAALREKFGNTGRDFVKERFGVEKMVNDLHHLYLRLAKNRGIT